MGWGELTERLASLVRAQAEVIRDQAAALARLGEAEGLEARAAEAEREMAGLLGGEAPCPGEEASDG